ASGRNNWGRLLPVGLWGLETGSPLSDSAGRRSFLSLDIRKATQSASQIWGAVHLGQSTASPVELTHKGFAPKEERPGILNLNSGASKPIASRGSLCVAARERNLARVPRDRRNTHQFL